MPLSRTERFLRLFTDVRSGEGSSALLMFANVFLILCAYYFVKPLREGWIAVSGIESLSKMEVKAYSSFGQSLLLLVVIAGYSRMVDRVDRGTLITRATLFCMSNMVIFWALQPDFFIRNLPGTGIVFYLWVGIFGVFVVAQFWAFAADLYDDEQGNRLIPLIAIGATAGAAFGAWLTESMIDSGWLPTEYLLVIALAPLALSIVLTRAADRLAGGVVKKKKSSDAEPAVSRRGALRLIMRHRYLLAVAAVTLLLNWVNTNGENLLFRVVQQALESEADAKGVTEASAVLRFTRDGTTAFYGNFYFWVNIVALVLQALVASRLLHYGGFGAVLLMLPVVSLMSYSAMALLPVLSVVKAMKVAENATDYSINNTARSVLWLPLSAETKYKGKPAIDTLFTRLGDGLAALTVLIGVQLLELGTKTFFGLNVALVLAWLALAIVVVREHGKLAKSKPPAQP
jgi:AAA family ATP:ADP antiporter